MKRQVFEEFGKGSEMIYLMLKRTTLAARKENRLKRQKKQGDNSGDS